jgi:phosphate transport system substrate-binding protein
MTPPRHRTLSALFAVSVLGVSSAWAELPIRIQGSPVVARVLRAAAPALRETGIEIKVLEDVGSSQAAAALGAEEIDVALMTRALTADERAAFPEKRIEDFQIGTQAVAVIVSRVVWESGVRSLTREQATNLYESQIQSWKQLGGEDRPIKFFDAAHGRGVWEIFAGWLYGEVRKAPTVKWEVVADGPDAQNAVYFNSGGASIVPLRFADGKQAMALAIADERGTAIEPTLANIGAGKYPLSRSVSIVFGEKPTRNNKKLLEFLLGEKGQALVAASDLLPLAATKAP